MDEGDFEDEYDELLERPPAPVAVDPAKLQPLVSVEIGEDPNRVLREKRHGLQMILDRSWPYIAWKIQHIREREQIPAVFRICARHADEYAVRFLATRLDDVAVAEAEKIVGADDAERAGSKLREMRSRIWKLNAEIATVGAQIEPNRLALQRTEANICAKLQERGHRIENAIRPPNPGSEVSRMERLIKSAESLADFHLSEAVRTLSVSTAQKVDVLNEFIAARSAERDTLQRQHDLAATHFSQAQLLHFIVFRGVKTLTPRILANAMAGLPKMGCRRSSGICTKLPGMVFTEVDATGAYDGKSFVEQQRAEGVSYQLLKLITQLVRSIHRYLNTSKELVDVVTISEKWLARQTEVSDATNLLRRNRGTFRRCVQRVYGHCILNKEALPYLLTRRFVYSLTHRTPEQQLLDDFEKLN